ncbi:MAG: hypothetical protein HYX78_04575 [Armatimonadetes bacterium]|nr:hypothetical protein [Armatimonadota bacterium]
MHWFWWLATAAVMVWYSTITIYVTIKGVSDIKTMLKRLSDINLEGDDMHVAE